jgi:RNA polymerase II subunit A small phosphatase-like protein
VLDLDETLVHSSFDFPIKPPVVQNFFINVKWDDCEVDKAFVKVRPHVQRFLYEMCKTYEVVIFTASVKNYAYPLVKCLDRLKYNFKILTRTHCTEVRGTYFKDLSLLGRDMKDIIILDNSPEAYALNRSNGLPIKSWYDDPNDNELIKLIPVLQMLSKIDDVRKVIPKIINKGNVNNTKFTDMMKHHRNASPLDDIYKGFRKLTDDFKDFFMNPEPKERSLYTARGNRDINPIKKYQNLGKRLGCKSVSKHNISDTGSYNLKSTTGNYTSQRYISSFCLFQDKPSAVKLIPKLQLRNRPACKSEQKSRKVNMLSESPSRETMSIIDDVSERDNKSSTKKILYKGK